MEAHSAVASGVACSALTEAQIKEMWNVFDIVSALPENSGGGEELSPAQARQLLIAEEVGPQKVAPRSSLAEMLEMQGIHPSQGSIDSALQSSMLDGEESELIDFRDFCCFMRAFLEGLNLSEEIEEAFLTLRDPVSTSGSGTRHNDDDNKILDGALTGESIFSQLEAIGIKSGLSLDECKRIATLIVEGPDIDSIDERSAIGFSAFQYFMLDSRQQGV